MIQCPKCQSTLPDWATTCQFCGTDVGKVVRPPTVQKLKKAYAYGPAPWVWVVYYIIAGWWVASGGFHIVREFTAAKEPSVIVPIVCGIQVLLGLGLLFRVEIARGIAHFFAWVEIFFGALGILGALGLMLLWPLAGGMLILLGLIDIVSAGLLIYVIGETG